MSGSVPGPSRSQAAVLAELLAISPIGEALPTAPGLGGVWPEFLTPLAAEISRFESFAQEMLVEVNPGTSNYLLADYERVLGPDPYGRDLVPLTVPQRQALALSRWTNKFGVRPADFIADAAGFGVTATIREYRLTEASVNGNGAFCGALLVNHPVEFDFVVTMPAANTASAQFVAPMIAGRAPAQTTPVFVYD
jgi:uncharacterized protein YmfQ (DUF2313 family)